MIVLSVLNALFSGPFMIATNKHIVSHSSGGLWIHSTRLHAILYSLLLIATPFVLLRSYTVDFIGRTSRSTFTMGGIEIPVVGTAAIMLFVIGLLTLRRHLTLYKLAAIAIGVLTIVLAQQITDYYLGNKFYDLQQNWHYLAYAIFAYIVHRDLSPRGVPLHKVILITYGLAISLSIFDEAFQKFLSSRVFDISDISKDATGVLIGIVLVHLCGKQPKALLANWNKLHANRLRNYLRHPLGLLIHLYFFTFIFLCTSSLLTDFRHLFTVVVVTLGLVSVYAVLFYISKFKWGKRFLVALLVLVVSAQAYSYVTHRSDNITYNSYGLTIYNGIPIPFFDVLIFPNGNFRLVDKKHFFNLRDQNFLLKMEPDILLIGSGESGLGGNGFPEKTASQFIYNAFSRTGTQLIILRTPEACNTFNRLRQEGKNVLFLLHNTC